MKKVRLGILSLALLAIVGCKNETKDTEKEVEVEVKEAEVVVETAEVVIKNLAFALESKSGSKAAGKVGLTEKDGMVTLEVKLYGLSEGSHAIHIHEKADCSSEDAKSSGGHWNPTFEDHGKWGAETGYHKGDIGNFKADAEGNARMDFTTDQWCLGCADENKNILGKAIVVHQGTDDFTSQPSGAAGARVSCGGIIQ